MTGPASKPPSKGMAMIAAYRAERLSQRPVHRSALHHSHVARRASRLGEPASDEPGQPIPADVAPPDASATETPAIGAASVFAGLVSMSAAEQRNEASPMRDVEDVVAVGTQPDAFDDGDADAEPAEAAAEVDAPAAPEPRYDPPLAEIGFGPGMLIRLSQLGFHTTSDLAHADAVQLRSELGDISRLVDVDAWIRSARQSCYAEPGDPPAGR